MRLKSTLAGNWTHAHFKNRVAQKEFRTLGARFTPPILFPPRGRRRCGGLVSNIVFYLTPEEPLRWRLFRSKLGIGRRGTWGEWGDILRSLSSFFRGLETGPISKTESARKSSELSERDLPISPPHLISPLGHRSSDGCVSNIVFYLTPPRNHRSSDGLVSN